LLELLDLNGALVTIDALGCQKAIACKIVDQGGHNALTVKDNQEHLLRRPTLSLLKAHPCTDSLAPNRFAAALNPGFLEEILRGDGILEKR
jgi:hypothetical protein